MDRVKKIVQIIQGVPASDGAGVKLKRILGTPELSQLDPFLLLDEFKNDNPDDYAAGFPNHPHRGFETLTYLVPGSFTHRDSKGHEEHLTAGSVQWMTAGRGIVHSEMPEQTEDLSWGYQLWLNLPAKLKMTEPSYQDLSPDQLPVVEKDGTRIKVLAGEYAGARSPGRSFIPFTYLDVQLELRATVSFPTPEDHNAFIYVIEGVIKTGPESESAYVKTGHLGVLGEGDEVHLQPGDGKPAHLLFASAQKLNEPVVRGGPFVMNTQGELKQAFTIINPAG